MSWRFLQGEGAVFWEGDCLAGAPNALLSLMPTPRESCLTASETEFLSDSPCGMTLRPSAGSPGEAALTSSPGGFPARTSARSVEGGGWTENAPASGDTWPEWFARFDLASCSWRTPQPSLFEALGESSVTWPRQGTMLDGACLELRTLVLPMIANVCGFSVGTPAASDYKGSTGKDSRKGQMAEWVAMRCPHSGGRTKYPNPAFAGWLMGFPEGWLRRELLETPKYLSWLQRHGAFLAALERKAK